jgi:ERCC4-type nuclease
MWSTRAVTLIIDTREPKHLAQELLTLIPGAQMRTLTFGDFIIEGPKQRFVIERKEINDLFASLKDGRLWAQMKGLEKFEGYKKVLLIEGLLEDASKWDSSITEARLAGTKASIMYGWNDITLMATENMSETVNLIKRLTQKVGDAQEETFPRMLGFTKDKRTANEESVDVLRGIDGIGETKGEALLKTFRSLDKVVSASPTELTQVLGKKDAKHLSDVFHRKWTEKKKKEEVIADEASGQQ